MASVLDWITGVGTGIAGLAAPVVDAINTHQTNKANKEAVDATNAANKSIAKDTNETNERIAAENLQFQRELQEYQKGLQEELFNREDTSYQRTAQDMIAAGLNPLSMQGTNEAGNAVAMSPLHNEYQAQQSAAMQAPVHQKSDMAHSILEAINASAGVANTMGQLSNLGAQRDKLQAETDRQRLENMVYAEKHGIKGDYVYNPHGWDDNQTREFNHKIEAGKFDSDSNPERIATAILEALNGRYDKSVESASDNVKEKVREAVPIVDAAADYVEGNSREQTMRARASEKGYTYLKGQTTSTIVPHPFAKYNTVKIYDKKGNLIDQYDMDYKGNIINEKKSNPDATNKSGKF